MLSRITPARSAMTRRPRNAGPTAAASTRRHIPGAPPPGMARKLAPGAALLILIAATIGPAGALHKKPARVTGRRLTGRAVYADDPGAAGRPGRRGDTVVSESAMVLKRHRVLAAALLGVWSSGPALGQQTNPVYTDDSPVAAETLARIAEFVASKNDAEAVRELQT